MSRTGYLPAAKQPHPIRRLLDGTVAAAYRLTQAPPAHWHEDKPATALLFGVVLLLIVAASMAPVKWWRV